MCQIYSHALSALNLDQLQCLDTCVDHAIIYSIDEDGFLNWTDYLEFAISIGYQTFYK